MVAVLRLHGTDRRVEGCRLGRGLERRDEPVGHEAPERAALRAAAGVGRLRLRELGEVRAVAQLGEDLLRGRAAGDEDVRHVAAGGTGELRLVLLEVSPAGCVRRVDEGREECLASGLAVEQFRAELRGESVVRVGRREYPGHVRGRRRPFR